MRRSPSLRNVGRPALAALVSTGAILAVIGCGGGAAASKMSDEKRTAVLPPTPGSQADRATASAAPTGNEPAEAAMTVAAPKDAAYTIYCRDFTGPDHAAVADRVKQQAEQVSAASRQIGKLADFYVVRGAQRSVLYYGFYRTYDEAEDKAEALRAKRDRASLESLVNAAGDKVFPRAVFTPLESPDPAAPPEWDLRNSKAYWTLVVCTYSKPGESKRAAVDSVRAARQMGYEAFYFFDENQAHVCIGGWPARAIKQQPSDGTQKEGVTDYLNPETIVVSNAKLPEGWKNLRDAQGRPFKLLETRVEIQDPGMRKLYGELEYSENGYVQGQSRPPLLMEVPKAIGRPAAIDAAPLDDNNPAQSGGRADPLLQRF